jgi:cell division septation protein DedD
MEQFNIPHQKVKEKSVYVLNLDIARIVLISAAIVGIIVVSFLLGMNFVRGGEGAKALVTRNDLFDSQKELDMLKTNIPDAADEDELSKPLDDKILAGEKDDKGLDRDLPEKNRKDEKAAGLKDENSDLLTKDNMSEPAPPEKDVKKKISPADPSGEKKLSRADEEDTVVKPARKQAVKNVSSKKKKNAKSKVVEVAGEKKEQGKSAGSGHYTIQVASFDRRTRAQGEVKALKEMRYDAYIDESSIKGKQYFRVRVGPVVSKQKALTLLKGIQEDDRYQESYMVRE